MAWQHDEAGMAAFSCCIRFPPISAIFRRFLSFPGGSMQHGCNMKRSPLADQFPDLGARRRDVLCAR